MSIIACVNMYIIPHNFCLKKNRWGTWQELSAIIVKTVTEVQKGEQFNIRGIH